MLVCLRGTPWSGTKGCCCHLFDLLLWIWLAIDSGMSVHRGLDRNTDAYRPFTYTYRIPIQ
jgi:hypothetical protein